MVAIVPALLGKVRVTSEVDEGPITVTLFVPLSLSSKNSTNPAEVEPFFIDIPALNTSFAAEVETPVCVVVPLISTFAFISTKSPFNSISLSETKSKTPSAD